MGHRVSTIIIVLLIVLLFGGGYGYRSGRLGLGDPLGIVLLVVVVVLLLGLVGGPRWGVW